MTGRIPLATDCKRSDAIAPGRVIAAQPHSFLDLDLVELVDAVVAAVDTHRTWELERLSAALEVFGAASMFAHELRQNGSASASGCICEDEGWL